MAFASSVLSDDRVSTLSSDNTISSIKEMTIGNDESYLYSVLEFNESMHKLEIEDKLSYYRALVESINGDPSKLEKIYESYIIDGIKRIVKFIEKIINWVKEKISTIFEINAISQSEFNMKKRISKGFVKDVDMEKEYTFTCFNYPMFTKIDSRMCDEALDDIFKHIDEICGGKDLPEVSDTSLKNAYSKLAKTIEDSCRSDAMSEVKRDYTGSRESKEDFVKFIKANIVFTFRKRMPYYSWKDNYIDTITDISKTAIADKMKYINEKLEAARDRVSRVETLDHLQKSNLTTYLSQASSIIRSYEWFLYYIMNMRRGHMKEVIRVYNNIVNNNTESMSESGIIHGEVFDSDTLFDNDDIRDFNRTEWIDLKLEAEIYQVRYNIAEERMTAAIREAVIRAGEGTDEEKMVQLEALDNQTWQKVKQGIVEFIKNIFKFFEQAIQTIMDKFNPHAIYMKTHEKAARANKIIIKGKSKINIFSGMMRVRESVDIVVPYDYEKMHKDLENRDDFFEKYILPKLERSSIRMDQNPTFNREAGINAYMRQYYGLPYGNDPREIEYDAETLEKNKDSMIKIISNPGEFLSKLRSELRDLENNANKATSGMSKPNPTPKALPETSSGGEEVKANNETSVYSYLYNTWVQEFTVDTLDKDGNAIRTDEDAGTVGQDAALENYLSVYKTIYTARINAYNSIVSEYVKIIKEHVKSYSKGASQQPTDQQQANRQSAPKNTAPNPTPA